MSDPKKKEDPPSIPQAIVWFAVRITDSGLAPWALVALFLLGGMYITIRQLGSKDTLTFRQGIGTLKGFAWVGWMIAFIEIPIFKGVLNRSRSSGKERIEQLQTENQKARELLRALKQSELKLEQ